MGGLETFSAGQLQCLQQLKSSYQAVGPPPEDCSDSVGAFKELCGCRPGYSDNAVGGVGKPPPFKQGLTVSLPLLVTNLLS